MRLLFELTYKMLRSLGKFSKNLHSQPSHGFATNEKAVKLRMKAVDSIRKITKAMKMVASSKMRMEMQRLNNGKNFGFGITQKMFENDPYVAQKPKSEAPKKILAVPITSDRLNKKRSLRVDQLKFDQRVKK